MTKGNFIGLTCVILFTCYVVLTIIKRKNIENEIKKKGYYSTAIIKKRVQSKFSSKNFIYYFQIKGIRYEYSDDLNYILSDKLKAGDTIIIKFLPLEPEKSMIIESIEYKTCYGIPPKEGWKELPKCR